tara:strand:+ start:28465 stop:28629 length:165 start_codon:yes stop_codon:yes gene_type:complete
MKDKNDLKTKDDIVIDFAKELEVEGLGQFMIQNIESIFDEDDFLAYATFSVRRF